MRRQSAFTLIEVLVAMAIFGVMSALAYMTLAQTLNNAEMLGERMDRLQAIQRTMTALSTELLQATPRPIRADLGQYEPALRSSFGGDFALELTHNGWPNSAGVPRRTPRRAADRVEDNELGRYHWIVLDRTAFNVPVASVVLEDLDSLTCLFLQFNDEWVDQWPPLAAGAASNSHVLPRAVEITLILPDEGELTRVVEMLH